MKDLWDSFRLQINERLSSPPLGSFVISWLIWNHRMIAVLFSGMTIHERFAFIDKTLYPNAQTAWVYHIVGPLGCALAYVFIYPWPAKWINGFWLRRQNELKKQRDEIEGATLLTKEEAEAVRRSANQRIRQTEEENQRLRDEIENWKKMLSDASQHKEPAPKSHDPFASKRQEIDRQKLESEEIEAELQLREARLKREQAFGMGHADPINRLPEGSKTLLQKMAQAGGMVIATSVKSFFPDENTVRVDSYVDRALELELIEWTKNRNDLSCLILTAKGRKYVVDRKLI
jgi:hypothetical protein